MRFARLGVRPQQVGRQADIEYGHAEPDNGGNPERDVAASFRYPGLHSAILRLLAYFGKCLKRTKLTKQIFYEF